MQVSIIGLGQVGGETFKAIELARVPGVTCVGIDIDGFTRKAYREEGYAVTEKAPASDVYIVAVYTTQQVFDVLRALDLARKPLVSLESTLDPQEFPALRAWAKDTSTDLVTCPHRFNPNDPPHHVFNLDRIIGGVTGQALERGTEFYAKYMAHKSLLHPYSFEVAALAKVAENAYRFMEIALAQELKRMSDSAGIDFTELRDAMNTKWNVKVLEARNGVGGKCLPKDMTLLAEFAKNKSLFELFLFLNEMYTAEQKEASVAKP
ncbi:hypothetical protein HY493_01635 [Candidatus Woesearchaeota archaeon]|nr:hypothetical protein [Candidatus Woesearchaeota archaeon]